MRIQILFINVPVWNMILLFCEILSSVPNFQIWAFKIRNYWFSNNKIVHFQSKQKEHLLPWKEIQTIARFEQE